jgi:hypothetical protein
LEKPRANNLPDTLQAMAGNTATLERRWKKEEVSLEILVSGE